MCVYLERSDEVGLVMQEDGALVRADVDVAGLWKNRSAQNDLCKKGEPTRRDLKVRHQESRLRSVERLVDFVEGLLDLTCVSIPHLS